MTRTAALALAAALCLATTVPATASTFVHMSPAELVAQTDALIQGRVIDVQSFWSDSGRLILTDATVEVEETLVGAAPATVKVRTFGGRVGDVRVEAHGFPMLEPDERVLLFLTTDPVDGTTRVLGYQEGHFRVVTRRDGVTLAVPMVEEDARYVARDGRLAPEPRSLELGTFKRQIQQLARRTRGDIER